MRLFPGILKLRKPGWKCCVFMAFLIFPICFFGQETNSNASGRVLSKNDEIPDAVTVTLIHESTQNKYVSVTSRDGYFHFFNLKPGGPYTITFSSVTHDTLIKTDLFIHLTSDHFFHDNREFADFSLQKKIETLGEVVVNSRNDRGSKSGIETNLTGS